MAFINVLAWVCFIVFLLFAYRMGSGALFFTGVLLLLFGWLVNHLLPTWSLLTHGNQGTIGVCQLVSFCVLGAAAFYLGPTINSLWQINFDPFDWLIGVGLGAAVAVVALHFTLAFLVTACTHSPALPQLRQTSAVHQFVTFDSWHHLMKDMDHMTNDEAKQIAPKTN